MPSLSPSIPPPTAISPAAFRAALKLYPSLVEKVYRSKLKNDEKKVAEALKRDRWRFEELPAAVAAAASASGSDEVKPLKASAQASRKDKSTKQKNLPGVEGGSDGNGDAGGLTKEAVERLVQWKITHGHSRPFLPAMVRKNEASAIQAQTSLAFAKLSQPLPSSTSTSKPTSAPASMPRPPTATITEALDAVCKLKGIGPATGTLILNVFDPVHVPFFQDEMFLWFFPAAAKADKLKYTLKEYVTLLDAAVPVLEELNITALELEQVAYVLGHVDLLETAERQVLVDAFKGREAASEQESHGPVHAVVDDGDHDAKDTSAPQQEPRPAHKGRKRVAKEEDDEKETQPPKRRSQRRK